MPGVRRKVKPMRAIELALRASVRHGAGILEVVAQRFLAEHVLAGGEQALHHLAMQGVGDDNADDIDVIGLGNRLPRGVVSARSRTVGPRASRIQD